MSISQLKQRDEQIDEDEVAPLVDRMTDQGVQTFVGDEEGYHFKFTSITNAPYILYALGDTSLLNQPMISIVWPRKPSLYATQVTNDLLERLPDYHLITVSGGADGIDLLTHRRSIELGIPTIMVLGMGLTHAMYTSHRTLLEQIVDAGGLVLSEFRLKQTPAKRTFPQRNRIIAWLGDTLFLPAAGHKSGSLITVDFALKMHKSIFSVPGTIYDWSSSGTNDYIARHQITPVIDFDTYLQERYTLRDQPSEAVEQELTPDQLTLIQALNPDARTPAQLAVQTGLPPHTIIAELSLLEMSWRVTESAPGLRSTK